MRNGRVVLLAVVVALGLAYAYVHATYKFHPNYKNYDVTKPSGHAPAS